MRSVGIKVLKNKLSEYVRLVESGETVLITDRDRVVAELVPPRARGNALLDDPVLAELVRKGMLTPAARPFTGPPPRGKPVAKLAEILRQLDADRADRSGAA
jgi:prevent-host-death family protein